MEHFPPTTKDGNGGLARLRSILEWVVLAVALMMLAAPVVAGPPASTKDTPPTTGTTAGAAPSSAPAGNGSTAYNTTCQPCHGTDGAGGTGARLAGTRLAMDAFTKLVRAGKGDMPPVGADQVSDADLSAMHHWLSSLKPAAATPQPSPAASHPAGAAAPARPAAAQGSSAQPAISIDLLTFGPYSTLCRACHGATGVGGFAPALARTRLGYTDFQSLVRRGRGRMPAFGADRFSDHDLSALYQALTGAQPGTASPGAAKAPVTAPPAENASPSAGVPAPPASPASATSNKAFSSLCASCHGATATGGIGPKLAGTALPIDTFRTVVRQGGGMMPPYAAGALSDSDLEAMYQFLAKPGQAAGDSAAAGVSAPSSAATAVKKRLEEMRGVPRTYRDYIYPNEARLVWSVLIVLYPFITGLVAGAFILASLLSVFRVKEIQPTYRLALLTSLAFLLVATLPLLAHLGHPERSYEIMVTPHTSSAMAMFGFVYAWYLMVVLCLEIWFEFRADMVRWGKESHGLKRLFYRVATLFDDDVSPASVRLDHKICYVITVIGIPSAFLLHGYVGFIFGSLKANPYWDSVLMPVVFLCSAVVSGIALVLFLYTVTSHLRWKLADLACLDAIAKYLLIALIFDFALESLDVVHRMYVAEESIDILSLMVKGKLFLTLVIFQVILGGLVPMVILSSTRIIRLAEKTRRWLYFLTSMLVLQGIFFMRWNVVIGGQLFSKSLLGFTTYKLDTAGREGVMVALAILALPLVILAVLTWLLPPWGEENPVHPNTNGHADVFRDTSPR